MEYGFITLAAAVPETAVADTAHNGAQIVRLMQKAAASGAQLVTFPELAVTGYTCADLFLTDKLIRDAEETLARILADTAEVPVVALIGIPVVRRGKTYNCAAVCLNGRILGVVPKSSIPNYAEFYELRHFTPAPAENDTITLCRQSVPFGRRLLFSCENMADFVIGCEICEDLWVADTPGAGLAMAGATVLCNLSASNETIGKDAYRRMLVQSASGRFVSAYVYADAGCGESTTDIVFSGHSMIAANGTILAENPPFGESELVTAVADLAHLAHDRRRMNTFAASDSEYTTVPFSLPAWRTELSGRIDRHPFIPGGTAEKASVCARILEIQSRGLAKRLRAAHAAGAVVALSGGLDSTLALLVTVRATDILGWDHRRITAVTMPCFGTTARTRSNAQILAEECGTTFREIDIKKAVDVHFRDIGHDPEDHSVVYENAQARERTQIIMDIANADGSLVIGTGDLSELALGWATYNGDHMSNYGVNGGVPKTLVRHIVSYCAEVTENPRLSAALSDILATPVSPELLPPQDGDIAQRTEDIVGPYELHDFFLYHYVRYGETPEKIYHEACAAFDGTFSAETIAKWLTTFCRRFYTQQFKRSALPDGPKVGSVALSPRGDWRMPSDAVPMRVVL